MKIKVNVSNNFLIRTQRDNQIRPLITCNTTSMIMGLEYSGYTFPQVPPGTQPEDALTKFLLTDKRVENYYLSIDPANARIWLNNREDTRNTIPPNEYHAVLAYGTNIWMGKRVVTFYPQYSILNIIRDLYFYQKPCVQSSTWGNFHHIVCTVGFIAESDRAWVSEQDINLSALTHIIIDDPFGDPLTNFLDPDGDNIELPIATYIQHIKPLSNTSHKWAHVFEKNVKKTFEDD